MILPFSFSFQQPQSKDSGNTIQNWTGRLQLPAFFSAALIMAGLLFSSAATVDAALEVPEGERITNIIVIGRGIPLKEQYELFDPKIGRNFDIKNFWIRADLRVRPEYRNNTCFGGGIGGDPQIAGSCNSPTGVANSIPGRANDSFVQQMTRLGIGYDLSPDVNFYFELIDSRTWGGNGDPINHTCANDLLSNGKNSTACSLGIRAGYMLVRNFAGIQGLGLKAGRQYLVFGDQSLLGHFDWANTGFSFDGIMTNYSTDFMDSSFGWFRLTETDLAQGAAVGSGGPNLNPLNQPISGQAKNAMGDVDMLVFYNQIKAVPWSLIEPFYIYYKNNLGADNNNAQGLGTPKHGNQTRHVVGNRIAIKKGGWDLSDEIVYQFGQMGDTSVNSSPCGLTGTQYKCLHINAWATRNWIGYTFYDLAWKPRLALNFDYASGDSRSNCTLSAAYGPCGGTANTFENFYPTNHIHMGYMDVMGWKNTLTWSANFQARPTRDDHIEVWYTNLNLANAKDNWYRASQGVYVYSKVGNTTNHIGDELDFTWTHMFMEGKLAFQTSFSYMFTGPYIRENLLTNKDQTWAYVQLWLNF